MTGIPQRLPLSSGDRESRLYRLKREEFDLLVIGGGINGAGIARDAAMRGLRTALVEKGDFASGTSSKSSKLIHGGVRYLEHGNFRLVHVACRERDLLRRRLAPHLVKPLAFLFPVYHGDPVGLLGLAAAMWLYDTLAIFRNIRRHRMLTRKRTLGLEPNVRAEGLRGAALYYDCFTDDARLTLETVLAAEEEGAIAINYVELHDFVKKGSRLVGAHLRDRLTRLEFEVRAHRVVNAAGPWADRVRRLDDPAAKPCLRLTKGVHVVVRRERVGNTQAVVMHSPRDQRILFVIPWEEHNIIGTTDTDFTDEPDEVAPDAADVKYLLEAANWFFPAAKLIPADVVSSYAGVRPLVASHDKENPSAVSREEEIFQSPSGLITLAGGKLTTYRWVAAQVVRLVTRQLGTTSTAWRRSSATADKPLPGGRASDPAHVARELACDDGYGLSREQINHLVWRYGSRTQKVVGLLRDDGDLKQVLVQGLPDIWAEAAFAVKSEMAVCCDDILFRRTHIALKKPPESSQVAEKIREKFNVLNDG
jgi:glycerol-3-phosphate dehydrogenase